MPSDFLAAEAGPILLVFMRVGAALMLIAGFGEQTVLPRLRLLLAFGLSLLIAPALAPVLPALPPTPVALAALVAQEIFVGLLLGLLARLCITALHVGGSVIAMQSGLSAASMFDPHEAAQSTVPATFLTAAAMALLFAADLHHLHLRAVAASYAVLPAGAGVDPSDGGELLIRLGAEAIAAGTRVAAPMLIAGFAVNVALGALSRMVPQFQVLSLALPAQLLLALLVLELSVPAAMHLFAENLARDLAWLDPGR